MELIQLQRSSDKRDLCSNLLEASEQENLISGVKLENSEVIGVFQFLSAVEDLVLKTLYIANIFIFLLAGQEVHVTWY